MLTPLVLKKDHGRTPLKRWHYALQQLGPGNSARLDTFTSAHTGNFSAGALKATAPVANQTKSGISTVEMPSVTPKSSKPTFERYGEVYLMADSNIAKYEISAQGDEDPPLREQPSAPDATRVEEPRPLEPMLTLPLETGPEIKTTRNRLQRAAELAPRITSYVDAAGEKTNPPAKVLQQVVRRLAAYQLEELDQLEEMGLEIVIYHQSQTPERWDADGKHVGGDYNPTKGRKQIRLRETYLTNPWPSDSIDDVLLHEIGHALSDSRSPDTQAVNGQSGVKRDHANVRGFFRAYTIRCRIAPSAMWSSYALASEAEYYAEGEAVIREGGARAKILQEKDPNLYSYLARQTDPIHRLLTPDPAGGVLGGVRRALGVGS